VEWIEVSSNTWSFSTAQSTAQDFASRLYAYVPLYDYSIILKMEADVARTSALYLTHPVNAALHAIYKEKYNITCFSELYNGKVRSDMCWQFSEIRDPKNERKTFAILEFKRPGALVPAQFEAARQRPRASYSTTMFTHNSLVILKQASAYALTNRVKFIACFDWRRRLLLLNFDQIEI